MCLFAAFRSFFLRRRANVTHAPCRMALKKRHRAPKETGTPGVLSKLLRSLPHLWAVFAPAGGHSRQAILAPGEKTKPQLRVRCVSVFVCLFVSLSVSVFLLRFGRARSDSMPPSFLSDFWLFLGEVVVGLSHDLPGGSPPKKTKRFPNRRGWSSSQARSSP